MVVLTACDGGPSPATAMDRERVMGALATDVYLPGYRRFAESTSSLVIAIDVGCAAGDLSQAPAVSRETTTAWLETSAYRLGPAADRRLQNAVSYPIDETKVRAVATDVTHPDDVDDLGSDARGLEAIDAVLADHGVEACPYLIGMSTHIDDAARELLDAWEGEDGYAQNLATDIGSQDGVEMAVNELKFAIDDLAFFRLAGGLAEEHGPSDSAAVVESISRSYRGEDGDGLSSLVAAASEEADQRVLDLLQRLEDTPPDQAVAVATELRNVVTTEVASLLSATLLLGDADGDS
jgi:hypothetical protein